MALTFVSVVADARPQVNAGLTAGVGGRGSDRIWQETVFVGGLRGDVLFGREGSHDFGLGPYVALETAAFDDARLGAGATLHVPVHDAFPLLLSVGPLLRLGDPVAGGVSSRVFFGSRSYNYSSSYVLSGGIVAGVDQTFGASPETLIVVAAHIDLVLLALPFVVGYEALVGG